MTEATTETCCNEGRMEELKGQAKETIDNIKARAQQGYERASSHYHETVNKVRATSLADVKTTIVNYVKDHPVKSATIFASIGILTGLLVARRRR